MLTMHMAKQGTLKYTGTKNLASAKSNSSSKYSPEVVFILTKIKARYIGEPDPEYVPNEVYFIYEAKDVDKSLIAAENKYGEAYLMPRKLFKPVED